jgi:hypothetical protein
VSSTRDHRTERWFALVPRGRVVIAGIVGVFCLMALLACGGGSAKGPHGTSTLARSSGVALAPPLAAGWSGWCIVITSSEGCLTAEAFRGPIIAAASIPASGRERHIAVVLTDASVASVVIGHDRAFSTRREPALPDSLRAVIAELPGEQLSFQSRRLILTPLDARGQRLRQPRGDGEPMLVPLSPSRHQPGPRARRLCEIDGGELTGLKTETESIVNVIHRYAGRIGHPFLSCASTKYTYKGQPLVASVLLDASAPGSRPAPLPGMRPVAGQPGIVVAPSAQGSMVARRVDRAWLAVAGGLGRPQQIVLLNHLRATVRPSRFGIAD